MEDGNRNGHQQKIEDITRIFLRPLASPILLGFFAFAVGSFIYACMQISLISQSEVRSVAVLLIAFAFPAELVAAVFAFLSRETLGATVLSIFSFAWLATGGISALTAPMATSTTLGLFNLSLGLILLLLGVSAVLGKPLLAAIIVLAAARFALNGIYELSSNSIVEVASGAFGFVVTAVALYGGLAFGLEDQQHRTILPIGRRGEAREAFQGDLGDQVGPIETEAGVRKQL